jgi:hypothetical protein
MKDQVGPGIDLEIYFRNADCVMRRRRQAIFANQSCIVQHQLFLPQAYRYIGSVKGIGALRLLFYHYLYNFPGAIYNDIIQYTAHHNPDQQKDQDPLAPFFRPG